SVAACSSLRWRWFSITSVVACAMADTGIASSAATEADAIRRFPITVPSHGTGSARHLDPIVAMAVAAVNTHSHVCEDLPQCNKPQRNEYVAPQQKGCGVHSATDGDGRDKDRPARPHVAPQDNGRRPAQARLRATG